MYSEMKSNEERMEAASTFHQKMLSQLPALLLENAPTLMNVVSKIQCKELKGSSSIQPKLSIKSFYPSGSSEGMARLLLRQILYLAESGASFYSTSLQTFKEWMKELGHPLVHRQCLSTSLLECTYRAVRLHLKKKTGTFEVEKEGHRKTFLHKYSSYSITFDGWTDPGKKNTYVAVTRHWFMDDSWELCQGVFDVIPMCGSHTGKRLAAEIGLRLMDVSSLLYCGITDNGANMVLACNLLLRRLREEKEEEEDEEEDIAFEDTGFRCQDHTLDLCINESVNTVYEVMQDILSVRRIMKAIKASPLLREILSGVLRVLGLRSLSPILDVRTRWNSTFYMLERFSILEPALAVMCHQGHFDHLDGTFFPDQEALLRIPRYIFYLRPFEASSRFLEGGKYVTIAHVPVILKGLEGFLSQERQEFPLVDTFRSVLLENLRRRFSYIFDTVNEALLAAALHPSYGHLDFLSSEQRDSVWGKVKEWASELYSEAQPEGEEDRLFHYAGDRLLVLDRLRHRFSNDRPHLEEWRYTFALDDGGNLLQPPDWKDFYIRDARGEIPPGVRFTSIHLLVKMFFCLPATTAPSERVFSCTGFLKPKIRSRLSPFLLEYLAVVRFFVRSPWYDFKRFFQTFLEITPPELFQPQQ